MIEEFARYPLGPAKLLATTARFMTTCPTSMQRAARQQLIHLLSLVPQEPTQLRRACDDIPDWNVLLHAAQQEQVLSLLVHALSEGSFALPSHVADWAKKAIFAEAARQLRHRANLTDVLFALESDGVRCAPFKGPTLGHQFYPCGVVRPSSDLDILIDPSNRAKAQACLRHLGYRVELPTRFTPYEAHRHEVQAVNDGGDLVELHLNVNSAFGVAVPTGPFLDRARPTSSPELGTYRQLQRADALLLVTLHASASLFLWLKWLMDVKLIYAAVDDDEAAIALERARTHRILSPIVYGLRTAERMGAPPRPCMPPARYRRVRHRLVQELSPVVKNAVSRRSLTVMPLVHTLLCDHPGLWASLVVFRAWDHVGRDKTNRR